MDLYVVTPSGETVASRVHAAVLICVKTAAILGAVLALGPLKEEDYMRLVKQSLDLTCITTGGMWACSTSSSTANMLAKPTAHNSWEVASASGRPEPCANTTRSRSRSPANKGCQSVLVFRTKRGQLAGACAQRFEQVSKHVNGIANARTFIQPKW